jgi:hypothetical protein
MRILQIHSTPAIASASAAASLRKAAPRPVFDGGRLREKARKQKANINGKKGWGGGRLNTKSREPRVMGLSFREIFKPSCAID